MLVQPYAFELAKKGFKVGLVARNQEKLDNVGKEITEAYGVETKTVVFDFDGLYTEEKVNELKEKLGVFDKVSILINNAGVLYGKKFNEIAEEHIQSIISVNIVGLTLVTKILLPKLLANETKGGIINIGSESATYIYQGMNVYSSTKSYVAMLSNSIAAEYPDKLDVLIAAVGPTKSNMNSGVVTLSSYPEAVVRHTLSQLGRETHTYGDFRQGLRNYFLNTMVLEPIIRWNDRRNIAALIKAKKEAQK